MLSLFILCFSCGSLQEKECSELGLLYISKASGNFDIYKQNLEGEPVKLTCNPSFDYAPNWNTSLQGFIYYSYVNDTFKIQLRDIDGEALMFDPGELQEYNLSPNGRYLVAQVAVGDYSKLVITNPNGTDSKEITSDNAYNGRAKWSPDSNKIAFISDRDGNNEVYTYNLEEGTTSRVTEDPGSQKYLSWSPNSESLAYTTEYYEEGQADRNDVFIIDLVTMTSRQITDNAFEDSEIAWSPDGDKIAFHSTRENGDQIYVMNIDGSNVKQITSADAYHGEPNWTKITGPCQD